jgi:hypothetical protein
MIWRMSRRDARQPDLFGTPAQGELFEPPKPVRWWETYRPDMAKIRGQLYGWLDAVKAAETESPWPREETRRYLVLAPQMANWFPEEERERYRADWAREVERLGLKL